MLANCAISIECTEASVIMEGGANREGEIKRASEEFVAMTTMSQSLIASKDVACRTSKGRPACCAASTHAFEVESSRELDPRRPTRTRRAQRVARIVANAEPMFPAAPITAAAARARSNRFA